LVEEPKKKNNMARIDTYVKDTQLSDKDKVIGSNYINTINGIDQFQTNNFTLKEISDFVGANVSTASVNLKANGGIVEETIDNVDRLAIDLGASNITGQLANSDLANSSITINGTAVSLGGSRTLGTDDVAEGSSNLYFTNARSRSAISVSGGGASYNSSTGVITLPAYFTLAQGNVTNASVSGQTLTLTRQSDSDVTFTPTANDFTNTLKTKLDNIESNADVTDTTNVVAALTAGTNITIAGNGTISSTDTNTQLSTEEVQDIVGNMLGGTETRIGVTYDDNNGSIDFVVDDMNYTLPAASSSALGGIKIGYTESGKNYPVELDSEKAYVNVPWTDTNTQLSTEEVQDIIGNMVSSNTETNISVTYDDTNGKLDFASTDTNTQLTDEQVQDIVGAMVSGNTESNVTVTYDDTNGKLDFTASGTQLSKETVQDYVGEMLSSNTETRISVTYDDTNNKINFVADDQSYTLPTASSSTLGGVKVGGNLTIDGNGVLNVGAIALTTVQTAANQTAHLALTAQEGDIVVRSDENKSYVHNGGTAGTMADYTELLTPTDAVSSVTTTDGTFINLTPNSAATGAITVTADLSATDGTSDTTDRFLTKDNKWAVPSYTTDTNTFRTVQADGASIGDTETLNLVGGTNVTLTENNGQITIAATDTDTNTFRTVEVDSNGNGTANTTLEASETLRFKKGSNITLSEAAGVITISSTDTNDNTFRTVTAGGNTLGASETLAFTEGSNVTITESGGAVTIASTDTNTQRSDEDIRDVTVAMLTAGTNISLTEDDSANTLTIAATDTNTQRTDEDIRDVVAAMLQAGTNVSLSEDDANNTLTITSTDTDTNTQLTTEQVQDIVGGMVSSNTETNITVTYDDANGKLNFASTDTDTNTFRSISVDGTSIGSTTALDIVAGNNITLSESSGEVTIDATNTNTQLSTEQVQDIVGAMVSGNTETNISVTYNDSAGKLNFSSTNTNTNILSGGTITGDVTVNGDMTFEDGHKLELGTGADLDLYHTSNNSYIDNNTGNLYIRCNPSGEIHLRPKESENGIIVRNDGKTELYFDNAKKLETVTGGVNVTGAMTASGDVVAYSDERLKSDIKTLDGSKVYDMRGVSFIKDNKESSGVIAQELEKIAPELVNNEGEYKAVAYGNVVGYLIEAIKDLKAEIEILKNGSTK